MLYLFYIKTNFNQWKQNQTYDYLVILEIFKLYICI